MGDPGALEATTAPTRRVGWWRAGWALLIVLVVAAVTLLFVGGSGSSHQAHRRQNDASATSIPAVTTPPPATPAAAPDQQPGAAPGSTVPAAPAAPGAPPTPAAAKTKDGSFTLVRFSIDDPGPSGLFSGQATIRNNASQRLDGDWEVRLYKGSDLVATAQASGVPIDPGQTVTVQMQSSDHYVAGVDRYEFKTAATYRV